MAKKYSQGMNVTQNLSATGLNRATDAAEAYANQKSTGLPANVTRYFENGVDIKIRNDTGNDLVAGSAVEVADYLLDDLIRKSLWFLGEVPAADTNTFGITLDAIPDGGWGQVRIAGIAPAWVTFSDAAHTRAILSPGNTYLDSAPEVIGEGAKVISKPAGDGLLFVPIYLPYTSQPPLVYFQLYDNKTLSSQPTLAKVLDFNGTAWVDSGIFIRLYDDYYNAPGFFTGKAGVDRGYAKLRKKAVDPEDPDDYEIIWMSGPAHMLRFTLTADRTSAVPPGEAVNATPNDYFLYGHNQLAPTSVWFEFSHFPKALSGAKGTAVYNDRQRRYDVIECDQLCETAEATLESAMCTDTETLAVENFTVESKWPFTQAPPENVDEQDEPLGTWTVKNPYGHQGMAGDLVRLSWSTARDFFVIVDVKKRATGVSAGFNVGDNQILQFTWDAAIEICSTFSTTIIPGEDCSDLEQ